MSIVLTEEQESIRQTVERVCMEFEDDYWLEHDKTGDFPEEFYRAMADGGWLGIAMPEEYGGAGLGVTEAGLMMHTVAKTRGGFSAASAIHLNIFGPHPIVVFGNEEQKSRFLPALIQGKIKSCFGVTEPNSGLDTASLQTRAERNGNGYVIHGRKIWTSTAQEADKILIIARTTPQDQCEKRIDGLSLFFTDLDRKYCDVREIPKMGRHAVDSNEVFIDGLSRIASARKARASAISCIASTRSGYWSAWRPSGSASRRWSAPPNTPRTGSSSTARSDRTRASSIPWPSAGWSSRRPI